MPLTITELMSKMPDAFIAEKAGGMSAVVHLKFTGADAGEWHLSIAGGKCEVAKGAPASSAVLTLAVDANDCVKVFTGELDGMQAYMQGKLKLTGDMSLAMKLLQMFKLK